METKYTQGEWKDMPFERGKSNGYIDVTFPDGTITIYGKGVERYNPNEEHVAIAEANAKLIAAAPDLLEALRGMCEAQGCGIECEMIAYDKAQSAIKKATS